MNQKIIIAVRDMFFAARIRGTAERFGLSLTFASSADQLLELVRTEKPTLIIFDLNDARYRPLETIRQLKADADLADIRIIGYLSHVQVDLQRKAREAGCDQVLAKSAFTQRLPQLLSPPT